MNTPTKDTVETTETTETPVAKPTEKPKNSKDILWLTRKVLEMTNIALSNPTNSLDSSERVKPDTISKEPYTISINEKQNKPVEVKWDDATDVYYHWEFTVKWSEIYVNWEKFSNEDLINYVNNIFLEKKEELIKLGKFNFEAEDIFMRWMSSNRIMSKIYASWRIEKCKNRYNDIDWLGFIRWDFKRMLSGDEELRNMFRKYTDEDIREIDYILYWDDEDDDN